MQRINCTFYVVEHRRKTSNQLIEELQKLGWMIFHHEQDKRSKEETRKTR